MTEVNNRLYHNVQGILQYVGRQLEMHGFTPMQIKTYQYALLGWVEREYCIAHIEGEYELDGYYRTKGQLLTQEEVEQISRDFERRAISAIEGILGAIRSGRDGSRVGNSQDKGETARGKETKGGNRRRRFSAREIELLVPAWCKGVKELYANADPKISTKEAFKKYAELTPKLFGEKFSWGTIKKHFQDADETFTPRRAGKR